MLLNKKTLTAVQRLARKNCANYAGGSCLLTGGACSYLTPQGGNVHCDYFGEAVLPAYTVLEQAYNLQQGISHNDRTATKASKCNKCGTAYVKASNRQTYCTPCGQAKQREHKRNYINGKRHNGI